MRSFAIYHPNLLLVSLSALQILAVAPVYSQTSEAAYADLQQYDPQTEIEYGVMRYSSSSRSDPIARLVVPDTSVLQFHTERGYLDSLLAALEISPSSQVLVFSRTSLNITNITPKTPRAIYFNDTAYVAMIPESGVIEIASMDPLLGPVFYTLEQDRQAGVQIETGQCLRCHDSYSMTGGGVPRFILGSGYTGANGNLVSHEGWILTDTSTPLQSRWGGWYVTGKHGKQVHLGNIAVNDPADLYQLEDLRIGNIPSLDTLIDTTPYPSTTSDIVALMVIEHQVEVQNLITRVNYDIRSALANNPELLAESAQDNRTTPAAIAQLITDVSEPLIQALLMVNETPLTDTIEGNQAYSSWFTALGPFDSKGRSLREFDLQNRLFRYPLSYLIYSEAFDHLPQLVRQHIYLRLANILEGDIMQGYGHISSADRAIIMTILEETKSEFKSVKK